MSHSDMMIEEMNLLQQQEHQKELEEQEQQECDKSRDDKGWWAFMNNDIDYIAEDNGEERVNEDN